MADTTTRSGNQVQSAAVDGDPTEHASATENASPAKQEAVAAAGDAATRRIAGNATPAQVDTAPRTVEELQKMSQQALAAYMWALKRQGGRDDEVHRAESVLSEKTGERKDQPQPDQPLTQDQEEYWLRNAENLSTDDVQKQVAMLTPLADVLSKGDSSIKPELAAYAKVLAQRKTEPQPGSVARFEQGASRLGSDYLQGRVQSDQNLAASEQQRGEKPDGTFENERIAYQEVLKERQSGQLEEPYLMHPEATGSLADPQLGRDVDRRLFSDGKRAATYAGMADDPIYGPDGVPKASDPHQGVLGDCFLIASMSALAGSHPDWIKQAISAPVGDQVMVTYYDQTDDGKTVAKQVAVDLDFPVFNPAQGAVAAPEQRMMYGTGPTSDAGKRILWPSILEKAWALTQPNGYKDMMDGGYSQDAMRWIAGDRLSLVTETDAAAEGDVNQIWGKITDAVGKGLVVMAGCYKNGAAHQYSVLGVDEQNGRMVKIRDPREGTLADNMGNFFGWQDRIVDLGAQKPPKPEDKGVFLVPVAMFGRDVRLEIFGEKPAAKSAT